MSAATDRAWRLGYDAGRGARFWHAIRRLWLPALVLGWVYLAVSRRTPDGLRVVAAFGALLALWLAVVLLPVELVWLVVRWRRHHRPHDVPFGPADETLDSRTRPGPYRR